MRVQKEKNFLWVRCHANMKKPNSDASNICHKQRQEQLEQWSTTLEVLGSNPTFTSHFSFTTIFHHNLEYHK